MNDNIRGNIRAAQKKYDDGSILDLITLLV